MIDPFVGAQNPHAVARRFCHWRKIPWENVGAVAHALELQAFAFDGLLPQAHSDAMSCYLSIAETCFARCGSPIEELFLSYVCMPWEWGEFEWHDPDGPDSSSPPERCGVSGVWRSNSSPRLLTLHQQRQIGPHRVDFTLESESSRAVIELDGHEFHERTKAQAARDKSRDRLLQEQCWKVLRFTGSEVWANPADCAQQALRIAFGGQR